MSIPLYKYMKITDTVIFQPLSSRPMATEHGEGEIDRLTQLRRRTYPTVHRIAQRIGGYAQCTMDPSEYVGTVDQTLGSFRSELRQMEFRRGPTAAIKRHSDGRQSAGSWVRRRSLWADKQLHVTVFRNGTDRIDTYAHWEDSWIRHPIRHYQSHNWDTVSGVKMMRSLLTGRGVPFVQTPP